MTQQTSSSEQPTATPHPRPQTNALTEPPAKPKRSIGKLVFNIIVYAFALAGMGIIGAWAFFQLGFTNNKGAVDENNRYLANVSDITTVGDSTMSDNRLQQLWFEQYVKLAAFSRYYPSSADKILKAAESCNNPFVVDRMLAAAEIYMPDNPAYKQFMKQLTELYTNQPQEYNGNVVPWMNSAEWEMLKPAIIRDSMLLVEAGRLTGVEPRMIVACLVGEQIRLFNSKREVVKRYLGPVKVLSVQSQFSYGVNGIKDFTAAAVERHLKDPASEFYMGKHYENLLDFETDDHTNERYKRLVDYRNHLYSYIYTGCILHQTMLQWKRAGYDISDRPDILFTLFNIGFSQSHPKADPRCGGSHISIDGVRYTFGAIGFDFYYSGELIDLFPYWNERFITDNGEPISAEEVKRIQQNMSNCIRPERGSEYRESSQNNGISY